MHTGTPPLTHKNQPNISPDMKKNFVPETWISRFDSCSQRFHALPWLAAKCKVTLWINIQMPCSWA